MGPNQSRAILAALCLLVLRQRRERPVAEVFNRYAPSVHKLVDVSPNRQKGLALAQFSYVLRDRRLGSVGEQRQGVKNSVRCSHVLCMGNVDSLDHWDQVTPSTGIKREESPLEAWVVAQQGREESPNARFFFWCWCAMMPDQPLSRGLSDLLHLGGLLDALSLDGADGVAGLAVLEGRQILACIQTMRCSKQRWSAYSNLLLSAVVTTWAVWTSSPLAAAVEGVQRRRRHFNWALALQSQNALPHSEALLPV